MHGLPVLARVRIGNGRDIAGRHRAARIGDQRAVQRALDHASLRRRRQFGPRQIQPSRNSSLAISPPPSSSIDQMVAAGHPEILHGTLLALRLAKLHQIDFIGRRLIVALAFHFEEGEARAGRFGPSVARKAAKGFTDFAVIIGAMHRDDGRFLG